MEYLKSHHFELKARVVTQSKFIYFTDKTLMLILEVQ